MSWLYLPELAAASSQPNAYLDGKPSAMSKTESTPSRSLRPESQRVTSTTRQYGETSEPSTGNPGVDAWILSLRASRASRGLQEAKGPGRMIVGTSGLRPFALLERSGPHGFYWRTLQDCFKFRASGDECHTYNRLWATWPGWGMWANGAAYPQPVLDSSTNGDGCGLLPTPVARDGKSFYVGTFKTALRVMRRTGSVGRQLHWMQYGIVFHGLKKGWANPRFSELMMGWPIGWSDLQPLERGRFQQWLKSFGNYLGDE